MHGMELEDPVKAIREISRDPTLKKKVKLDDGRQMTAIEIQRVYLERAKEYLAQQDHDPILDDVWKNWAAVLDELEDDPMQLVHEVDWVTKKHLIQSYVDKKDCGWDDPRVFLLDLQFHDVKRTQRPVLSDGIPRAGRTGRGRGGGPAGDVDAAADDPREGPRRFYPICASQESSYTVDWTYLKLNGYWEETILCMDPFSAVNRRVEELVSQVSGRRFYR